MSANDVQIGGEHYKGKAVQPWAAMEAWMTPEEFRGYLRGCVIKYVARCYDKGGVEDLKKAGHYIQKLVEVLEASDPRPPAPIDNIGGYYADRVTITQTAQTFKVAPQADPRTARQEHYVDGVPR